MQFREPNGLCTHKGDSLAMEEADFSKLRNFVLFVGYPRSGHSLVGSLIDAHPHAIIAHEVKILAYVSGLTLIEHSFYPTSLISCCIGATMKILPYLWKSDATSCSLTSMTTRKMFLSSNKGADKVDMSKYQFVGLASLRC